MNGRIGLILLVCTLLQTACASPDQIHERPIHALRGEMSSKDQLAREAIHIEQKVLAETVGCQDQIMAAHGGLNQVVFNTDGSHVVRPLTLPPDRLDLEPGGQAATGRQPEWRLLRPFRFDRRLHRSHRGALFRIISRDYSRDRFLTA